MGLFSGELIFRAAYYWREFCISKWVGLDNENSLNHQDNVQPKTATCNPYYLKDTFNVFVSEIFSIFSFSSFFFFWRGGLLSEFYGIMSIPECKENELFQ